MIYYQIGAAVIILILMLIGAYRGIIRTLLNLIGLALDAFLSYHISGPLAQGMYDTFFKQTVITKIQEAVAQKGVSVAYESALSALPDWLSKMVGAANQLTGQGIDKLVNNYTLSDGQTLSIAQAIEAQLAPVIVAIMAVIIVFILFVLLMIIIKLIIRLILKALDGRVLRTFDRFFGGILGGVEGVLLVYFLCSVFNINLFA